jgi:hypothetical protein
LTDCYWKAHMSSKWNETHLSTKAFWLGAFCRAQSAQFLAISATNCRPRMKYWRKPLRHSFGALRCECFRHINPKVYRSFMNCEPHGRPSKSMETEQNHHSRGAEGPPNNFWKFWLKILEPKIGNTLYQEYIEKRDVIEPYGFRISCLQNKFKQFANLERSNKLCCRMVSIIIENSVLFCNYENSKRERAYSARHRIRGQFSEFCHQSPIILARRCNSTLQ